MKIVLRIDDFPYGTPEDWDRYKWYEASEKMYELERMFGVYLLGVVPEAVDFPELYMLQRYKKRLCCAHGFTHGLQFWRPSDSKGGEYGHYSPSELKYYFRRMEASGFYSDTIIPPFNCFNQLFLDTANDRGRYRFITGGPETRVNKMDGLRFGRMQLKMADHYCGCAGISQRIKAGFKEGETFCFHFPWETADAIRRMVITMHEYGVEGVTYGDPLFARPDTHDGIRVDNKPTAQKILPPA